MTLFRTVSILAVIVVIGIVAGALYVFYDSSMQAEDKGAPSGPVTPALLSHAVNTSPERPIAPPAITHRTASPSPAVCRSSCPSARSIQPTSRRIAKPA